MPYPVSITPHHAGLKTTARSTSRKGRCLAALLPALALWAAMAGGAAAQGAGSPAPGSITVQEAHGEQSGGRLLLVDIRSPGEWSDTGLPQGAIPLDVDATAFEVRLAGLRLDHPAKRIALIDRTGAQAVATAQKLGGRGWRDLVAVRGGMLGPGGWLAEKLPVTEYR
ncbi:rhodanese-like domain-containing protein [Bosea sp. SSUT16]|uniref:Rhodanese-like domain-containing protein n=1 Tax=Bosea spartocytisi TaxID=2773451 RepID=A0A927EBE7_9HYPH|nr:rhodanese-like domain-containing protein [Bosea spartocytisi]MBD3845659.1 rhodanese-like domain-containing protein [Bosea spartocytisi]MCT4472952.1 rhodanese-like domain-containing protein [Bosea spartocytisi]